MRAVRPVRVTTVALARADVLIVRVTITFWPRVLLAVLSVVGVVVDAPGEGGSARQQSERDYPREFVHGRRLLAHPEVLHHTLYGRSMNRPLMLRQVRAFVSVP